MIGVEAIVSMGRLRVVGIFYGRRSTGGRELFGSSTIYCHAGAVRCRWRDIIRIIYRFAIAVAAVVVAL